MKILKRVLLGLSLLVVILVLSVFVYTQNLKPQYKGTVKLAGVKNTEVVFDEIGVPHIFSDSEVDAMKVLGYVHAQDRLWQMELLRRIASGRLAEILGEDLVSVDEFFSHMGIDETTEKQVANLEKNPKVNRIVNAYLEGVNAFIDNGTTPIEFTLLGIKKEHYTARDMFYVTAYMGFSFANAFKTDPLLSYIDQTYGKEYLKDIAINPDENTVFQGTNTEREIKVSLVNNVLSKLPVPPFIGSNGWVIGSEKSATGKVVLENDPHIGYAQPCVWYQAHIKTPTLENYGFYLGLFPFPLLAHNREYAYGVTMFENDDINFYQLKSHPTDTTKYITANGTYNYEYIAKEIKVKGKPSKNITIKKTVLGTVFNQQQKTLESSQGPITIQWVFNEQPSKVLQCGYGISRAKSIKEFESSLDNLTAPGLNFVYGDALNNIALWSVAKLYEFDEDVNTKFILDGMNPIETNKKWLSFSENPKAINPKKGYVMTANVQADTMNGRLFHGYYLSRDRAVAIVKGLEAKKKLTVLDNQSLANNNINPIAVDNMHAIAKGIQLEELSDYEVLVLDRLLKWKGNHGLDNVGVTIYYKLTAKLLKNTFSDELPEDYFEGFVNTNLGKRTLNKFIYRPNSPWWDNVNTKEKEDFKQIATTTFKACVKELKTQLGENIETWKWEKVHTIEHEHALAKMELLKKIFNVGPFPITGGNQTINNTMWDYTDTGFYKTNAGPSTRRIVDFSDIENSYAILPTGQSGNFMSPFYDNQAEDYAKGKYHRMLLNEAEIRKSKNVLIFKE
ncbi:penicillin acylase family protein [Wenyingzhuangia sp. IMCC45574]